jgi:hypothetical protein
MWSMPFLTVGPVTNMLHSLSDEPTHTATIILNPLTGTWHSIIYLCKWLSWYWASGKWCWDNQRFHYISQKPLEWVHNSDTQFTINGKTAYTVMLIGDLQWKFRTILSFWAVGSWFQLVKYRITANCSTEGANENFPIWDIFKEFPISRSVLNGFGWKIARYTRLIHAELVIERNL